MPRCSELADLLFPDLSSRHMSFVTWIIQLGNRPGAFWHRRWMLTSCCLIASGLSGALLALLLSAPGYYPIVALQVTGGFLAGPCVHYFIFTGSTDPTWAIVAVVCFLFMISHPVRPHFVTGLITILGYSLWYWIAATRMLSV